MNMVPEGDLVAEVERIVEAAIDANTPAHKTWITHQVVSAHKSISGEDVEWYRVCAYGHIGTVVRNVIRRYKPSSGETSEQLVMPGCERLQRAYLVTRAGDSVVVPIGQCTDQELALKEDELRRMARGCQQHADEIAAYRAQRKSATGS